MVPFSSFLISLSNFLILHTAPLIGHTIQPSSALVTEIVHFNRSMYFLTKVC